MLSDLEELHVERTRNKGLQPRRVDDVANFWRHLREHIGERREVATLTDQDPQSYEGARRAEGAKGQTIRRELQALKLGLKLAKREGLIHESPIDWDIAEPIESDEPDENQAGKTWPPATIRRVLAALSAKAKRAGYHDMLRLVAKTGLRLEEFRRVKPTWVHSAPRGSPAKAMLDLPPAATKTGRARSLPLDKDCVDIIRKWSHRFAGRKFNHALSLASAKAKLPACLTPRDLRASYLTRAASTDPLAAQRLGGHANLATTGLYLHAAQDRAVAAGIAAALPIARPHTRKRAKRKVQ